MSKRHGTYFVKTQDQVGAHCQTLYETQRPRSRRRNYFKRSKETNLLGLDVGNAAATLKTYLAGVISIKLSVSRNSYFLFYFVQKEPRNKRHFGIVNRDCRIIWVLEDIQFPMEYVLWTVWMRTLWSRPPPFSWDHLYLVSTLGCVKNLESFGTSV